MKPLATTDEKQIEYINSGNLGLMYPQGEHEGIIKLYAIPDTHRVVSVELLSELVDVCDTACWPDFSDELRAIIDNKGGI